MGLSRGVTYADEKKAAALVIEAPTPQIREGLIDGENLRTVVAKMRAEDAKVVARQLSRSQTTLAAIA